MRALRVSLLIILLLNIVSNSITAVDVDTEIFEQEIDGTGYGTNDDVSNDDHDPCAGAVSDEERAACKSVKISWNANADGRPPEAIASQCEDRIADCPQYAASGECTENPGWMIMNCPRSCDACHLRDPALRCNRANLDMDMEPTYRPGEMNAMFRSIIHKFGSVYKITILSEDPWVVIFDDFLTDIQSKSLIGTVKQWEQSTDTGLTNEFGETGRLLSTGRTSTNAWCTKECESHPEVQKIFSKIEGVTNVLRDNFESLQILKYELGQRYEVHHDADDEDKLLACGPRVLTFFLYLSDVEEGGGTHFPLLNITVTPKRGRALLWPSVMDHDPEEIDHRTEHEALPVIKGRKFAANSWIHLYDYTRPNLWGCTGVFD